MRFSRPLVINVVLAVVVIGAIVATLVLVNPFGWGSASTAATGTQLTSTVQQGVVSKTISTSGSIAPIHEVSASFGTAGTISSVNVAVGQSVAAGTVIGSLDTTSLQKALDSANTTLKNAQSAYASASNSQGVQAAAQVTTAQQAVSDATANFASANLVAPISGVVVSVGGTVGQKVSAGSVSQSITPSGTSSTSTTGSSSSAFATIADTSSLTVTANIAEADISSVTIGQAATVTFPALTNVTSPAKVSFISPTATSSNSVVTYATTITLDAATTGIRLGQTAQVAIVTKTSAADALYVPAAAITTANGESTVKVVATDGTSKAVTVTLGVVGDAGTEILTGLTAGETIVIGTVSATTTSTTNTNQQRRFGTGTGTGGFGGAGVGTGGGTGAGGFGGRTGG